MKACNCSLPSMYHGCCANCQNNRVNVPWVPMPAPYLPQYPFDNPQMGGTQSVKIMLQEEYDKLIDRIKKLEEGKNV